MKCDILKLNKALCPVYTYVSKVLGSFLDSAGNDMKTRILTLQCCSPARIKTGEC